MIGRTSLWRAVGLAGLVAAVAASGVAPAAAVGLSVTPTTTPYVIEGVSFLLSRLSVTGAETADPLAVTLATDRGTVQVDTSTGIEPAYGNVVSGTLVSGASVSFTGTPTQVNAALEAAHLTAPAGSAGESANVTISAYVKADDNVYSAGHFYRYVASPRITWADARAEATSGPLQYLGQSGYLVNITSPAENDVVSSRIAGADNVWIGAHAVAGDGVAYFRSWQWADGPEGDLGTDGADVIDRCSNDVPDERCAFTGERGYSSWGSAEPNNTWGEESVGVTNWRGWRGQWNDVKNDNLDVSGYVVEYGDGSAFSGVMTATATVPILGVPGAPTGVSADAGVEQATVYFTAPASDGGSPITADTGYAVTASPGGTTVLCGSSPCTVPGLTAWTPYTFSVTASSALGTGPASDPSAEVTPVPQDSGPSVVAGTVPQLMLGAPASTTFTVDGYPAPTFAVTAGALPVGMSLAASGVLSGTPSSVGAWSATITATNALGSASREISGHVGNPPSAVIGALPALVWGTTASATLSSTGYPAPTFAVTAGALPAGLSLDPVTGVISGMPTSAHAYSVTVTASNEHGSQAATLTGTVAPIRPSAPSAPVATPGHGEATIVFEAPDSDGGSPVTSYEVRVDGGEWQPLSVTLDGSTVHGLVTGLANGVEIELQVRALNVAGAGATSGPGTVTPVFPPPAPVAAPTAVAGTSSAVVTWLASTERDVTGYTVIASPGPATCTVGAGETSCMLGAVADRSVTFTVVTHSRWGDSAPSQASAAVVPSSPAVPATPPAAAPTTLTTSEGDISSVRTGETLTVIGTGFAPFSTATVVIYSTPRTLGTVRTDAAGAFSLTVTVPADLEAGAHTFVAYGVDAAGDGYAMRLPVAIPAATPAIAQTGVELLPFALLALLLLGAGVTLRVAAVRVGAPDRDLHRRRR